MAAPMVTSSKKTSSNHSSSLSTNEKFFPENGVLSPTVSVYHSSSWWLTAYTSATPGSQREIVSWVAQLMLIFGPFHFFDAVACATGGVLRGAGKQKIAAIMNAVGYYLIGLPIGISLMFGDKLGVIGLWCGMLVCVFIQAVSFIVLALKMNWTKASEEAQVRAGVNRTVGDVDTNPPNATGAPVNCAFKPDMEGAVDLPTGVPRRHLAASQMSEQTPREEDTQCSLTTVGEVLPIKSLLFRRGLAVVIAILALIIGLLIRFTLTANG